MSSLRLALSGLVFVAFAASTAFASSPDETRCRSLCSNNWSPAYGHGTVTGLPNHLVVVVDVTGHELGRATIDRLSRFRFGIGRIVENVRRHSDGEISIDFNYALISARRPSLPGGTIEVRDSTCVIDRDRLAPRTDQC